MASLIRRLVRRAADETGAELIEFAMVFPILLLLVAGIADFGFLFQRYEVVTNAAREGARMATLPGYTDADVTQRVQSYLTASGLTATPTISVTWGQQTLTSGRVVNLATVDVSYPHPFSILAPVSGMIGGSGPADATVRGVSVMRVEGAGAAPAGP